MEKEKIIELQYTKESKINTHTHTQRLNIVNIASVRHRTTLSNLDLRYM